MKSCYDIIYHLWEHGVEGYDRHITLEEAQEDLDFYAREYEKDGDENWKMPEEMTAELYCEIWNKLVSDTKKHENDARLIY